MICFRFVNIDIIDKITCPIFFIHGQKDNLVPYTHSIDLAKKCKSPFQLEMPEYMDHNNFEFIDFIDTLTQFLKRHNILCFSKNKISSLPTEVFEKPDYMSKLSQSDVITSIVLKLFRVWAKFQVTVNSRILFIAIIIYTRRMYLER